MILLDFSSINCDMTMVDSINVRKNKPACAAQAVVTRSAVKDPDET